MEYLGYIQELAQKRNAIIKYVSKGHTTCCFPYSIVNSKECEAFLSYREGQDKALIEVHFRLYSDIQDDGKHLYSMHYGIPPKDIPLGESFIAVKRGDRDGFVTRICSQVSLSSFLEIINMKSFSLFEGKISRTVDVLPVSVELSLFLASCYGQGVLSEEMKGFVVPLIEEEKKRMEAAEEEKKKLEEEEARKRKKAEEEKKRKEEEERRRKVEEERRRKEGSILLLKDSKDFLAIMLDFYQNKKYHKDHGVSIREYRDGYYFWDYKYYDAWLKKERGVVTTKAGYTQDRITQILGLLRDKRIIQKFSRDTYNNEKYFFVQFSRLGEENTLFSICSIQQLYDILDDKITVNDVKRNPSKTAQPSNNPAANNNIGCYIATAVYGSYNCPEVWTLRRFRDQALAETWYGRLFIKIYYAISPTLVRWFGRSDWFKTLWRKPLDRLVIKLQNKGFEDTPYND